MEKRKCSHKQGALTDYLPAGYKQEALSIPLTWLQLEDGFHLSVIRKPVRSRGQNFRTQHELNYKKKEHFLERHLIIKQALDVIVFK
jgi:hypothetical protein